MDLSSKTQRETLAERLRTLRRERNMTLCSLAIRSDVGIDTISEIETKTERVPSMRTLMKLAQALGVPVTDLLASE